jgi:hypothetical protein
MKFFCKRNYQNEFVKGRYYNYFITDMYGYVCYNILTEYNLYTAITNIEFINDKFLTEKEYRKLKLEKINGTLY